MKKRALALIIALIFLLFAAVGCAPGGASKEADPTPAPTSAGAPPSAEDANVQPDTLTDLLGREVAIPANAKRFAAIGPGCLRLYCYVADVAQLVGIETMEADDITGRPYMIANEDLLAIDIIGPGGPNNAPDAEKLLVADPDVIFSMYSTDASAIEELQQKTGIPVVALSYGTSELFDPAVDASLALIGKITGNEARASEAIEYFAAVKADLSSRVQGIAEESKPLAYMGGMGMRGAHGIESTTGNFSIFNAIEARNAVAEAGIDAYIMLDKEKLLEMDPDYIFLDGGGLSLVYEDYQKNAAFYRGLQAFQNKNVYMHMPYNRYYTNIDVAIADAYYMGKILYPEQFADIDPAEKFDEITQKLLGKPCYVQMAEAYYGGYQQLVFE